MKKDVTSVSHHDTEPTVGSGAVYLPMWLVGLLGFLLYWGCNYVDDHGGSYSGLVYAPYLSTNQLASLKPGGGDVEMDLGRVHYKVLCAPCHQESGLGAANLAPPLAGSEWVAGPPGRVIRIPQTGLTGPIKVNGKDWNQIMFAAGAGLDDKQLAAVLSYIRNSWGNSAPKVTAEQVKKVRGELQGRTDPHTAEELLKVTE
jgi:mono/diheme cytochrome c family protein